ncbi:hypothetical protein VaNZ11_011846 [Volvox africanus]|uniref:EGF-like domain-containing protein n=1 Tax=Volvox africanus TaxID=51714 RepID=A0ABQ5SCU3_9CHLO|nr:hypothetical protein VaNZ11_011846 [Volvox africanus]
MGAKSWSLLLAVALGVTATVGSQSKLQYAAGSLTRPHLPHRTSLHESSNPGENLPNLANLRNRGSLQTTTRAKPRCETSQHPFVTTSLCEHQRRTRSLKWSAAAGSRTADSRVIDAAVADDDSPMEPPVALLAQVPDPPPQLVASPPPGPPGRRPCSEPCYLRATCNEELGRCDCPKQLTGSECQGNTSASYLRYFTQTAKQEAAQPLPCLNRCNARGKCVLGECVCEKGFFSADCSLSIGPSGKPVILEGKGYLPRDQRPYIYVYDIPHRYSSWYNPRRMDREAHWTLWQQMLPARVLVADGDEADWFFIPVKLRNSGDGPKLFKVIKYIQQHWPWYDRLQGHRHFVIHMGDSGRGEVSEDVRQAFINMTWLHHWGLYEDFPYSGWKAAHRPGKDVVIPVAFKTKVVKDLLSYSPLHPRAQHLHRDRGLLFAGRICGDYSPPDTSKSWPHCKTNKSIGYSQGARQMVHFYHHNRTGYKVVTADHTYLLDIMRYRWCLAPSGGGHGHRQTLTAAMGCLPVVVSDQVMQPFEPELDWSAFSVRVALSDVPGMHNKLDAVGDIAYDRMQAAVQCAAQHLLYSSSNGAVMQEDGRWDAFETVMEILRMQQLYPGLDPGEYGNRDERFRLFMGCGHEHMADHGYAQRQAWKDRYPVPLEHVYSNQRSFGWDVMYEGGLAALIKRAGTKSEGLVRTGGAQGGDLEREGVQERGGGLQLCSVSRWDVTTDRCEIRCMKAVANGGCRSW